MTVEIWLAVAPTLSISPNFLHVVMPFSVLCSGFFHNRKSCHSVISLSCSLPSFLHHLSWFGVLFIFSSSFAVLCSCVLRVYDIRDDDVMLFTVSPNPNVIKSHFPRVCTTNHQDIDGDKLFMTFPSSALFPSSFLLLVIASFPFYFRIVVSSLFLYVFCISISPLFISRLIKTETGRAILRVISGPRAFRVVLLARLTPIPFGLQNTIFGVSFNIILSNTMSILPSTKFRDSRNFIN